jgi:uroporphyrinogen decarboxylase
MTSKERVLSAIQRKPIDRLPRYFWIGKGAAENICKEYHITPDEVEAFVGNDVMQPWLSINKQMSLDCEEGTQFVDEWGITWQREGAYNTVVKHPLAGLDEKEITEYPLPDPYDTNRYTELKLLIDKYGTEYFIGADVSGTIFEPCYHLRGLEDLMVDMAMEAEEADVLLDKVCEFSKDVAIEATKMGADWIWLGDDMGTQNSMLIPPYMWRKYFKPRMKYIIDSIHAEKPDMIIAYHSCGSIMPIIGDLAEIGINVLNPLQASAIDMDHEYIKKQYGDKLTFFCGLDTQMFLVNAKPEVTKVRMKQEAITMSAGGGYIVGVSHALQHDVPVYNIKAMLDALEEL